MLLDLLPLLEQETAPSAGSRRRRPQTFFVPIQPARVQSSTTLELKTASRVRVLAENVTVLELQTAGFPVGARLELMTGARIRARASSQASLDVRFAQRVTDSDEALILSLAVLRLRRR